jgi:capsular polysaccharide transport system permease protein
MPPKPDDASFRTLARGFKVQMRSINALVIRDMMLRYGRNNIGFLWIVLEPMLLTSGVMLVWSLAHKPMQHGLPVVALVLSGYMPLTLWRHTSNGGILIIRRSLATLYHRHLSMFDIVCARMFTELASVTLALMTVYGALLAFGIVQPVADPGYFVLGWLLMAGLGSAFALLAAGLSEMSESVDRFLQPIQYLILPISGTFFMVDWLPYHVQPWALYNPLVHCYEAFRAGLFGEGVQTHFNAWYPLAWIVVMVYVGFHTLDMARERVGGS